MAQPGGSNRAEGMGQMEVGAQGQGIQEQGLGEGQMTGTQMLQ